MKGSVNRPKGNILANVILTKQYSFTESLCIAIHKRFTLLAINTTLVIEDTLHYIEG